MSRSRKRTPIGCWVVCKSQKRGKQFCNRKFRRREHVAICSGIYERLPVRCIEVMDPWNLGGDGKLYFKPKPNEEWFVRLMRK